MAVNNNAIANASLLVPTDIDLQTQNTLSPIMKVVLPIFLTLAAVAITAAVLIVTGSLALSFYVAIVAFAVAGVCLLILTGFGIYSDYINSSVPLFPSTSTILNSETPNSILQPLVETETSNTHFHSLVANCSPELELKVQNSLPFNERLPRSIAQLRESFVSCNPTLILAAVDEALKTLEGSENHDVRLLIQKGKLLAELFKKLADNEIQLNSGLRNCNSAKIVQHANYGLKLLKRFPKDALTTSQTSQFIIVQEKRLSLFKKLESILALYRQTIREAHLLKYMTASEQSKSLDKFDDSLSIISNYLKSFKVENNRTNETSDDDYIYGILHPFRDRLSVILRPYLVQEDDSATETSSNSTDAAALTDTAEATVPVEIDISDRITHPPERISTSPVAVEPNAEIEHSEHSNNDNANRHESESKAKSDIEFAVGPAEPFQAAQPIIEAPPVIETPPAPEITIEINGKIVNSKASIEAFSTTEVPTAPTAPIAPTSFGIATEGTSSGVSFPRRKVSITKDSLAVHIIRKAEALRKVVSDDGDGSDVDIEDTRSETSNHSSNSDTSQTSTKSTPPITNNTSAETPQHTRKQRRASLDQAAIERSKKILAEVAADHKKTMGALHSFKLPEHLTAPKKTSDNEGWEECISENSPAKPRLSLAAAARAIKKINLSGFSAIEKMAAARSQQIQGN